jgi:hypothetical protein
VQGPDTFFQGHVGGLHLLHSVLLVDALGAGCGALLVQLGSDGTVELLFEDGLGLDRLELGLEVSSGERAGIASATWVDKVVTSVFDLVTFTAPMHMRSN